MNNLSWFLYFADVLPNVAGTFATIGIIITCFAVAGTLVTAAITGDAASSFDKERRADGQKRLKNKEYLWPLKFPWIGLPLIIASTFVPSRESIYLIAGSEAGQMAIESETGQNLIDEIQLVIEHQLDVLQGNSND